MFLSSLLLAALATPALPVQADGRSGAAPPSAAPLCVTVEERPVIDGVLDEPLWERATRLTPLTQVRPNEGAGPSQDTEVLLAFDAERLYVGLRCFDDDPTTLRATQRRRDARLDPDDSIELLLDPFLDRRNAFWFQIGPGGARGDALIVDNGSDFNKRWDAIWQGRSRVTDEGWFAELEIPFASLNFDPDQGTWGFNFRRFIRRHDEEARWASPDRNTWFFSVAQAGTLTGMTGLDQGLGLDVVPFFLSGFRHDSSPDPGPDDFDLDAGLDLFWQPTPSSKLSVSVNTDFAETEVDSARVNLTRFSLFFPEKRDFFLEDSGYFQFGRGSSDVIPFFSRRVGLSSGEEVPILAATKYTGRTGSGTFGLLGAFTDKAELEDGPVASQELFAARYAHHVDDETQVGLIATAGDPSGEDPGSSTVGVDWTWRTNDFNGGDDLVVSAWALAADNDAAEEGSGTPVALSGSIGYPNDELDLSASITHVEEDFDPALGFVRRPGSTMYRTEWQYRPYAEDSDTIERYRFALEPVLYTNADDELETLSTMAELFGVEFYSGDRISLQLLHEVEDLTDGFDLVDTLTVDAGRYQTTRAGIKLNSADRREVGLELDVFGGEFWDGTRTDYELEIDWRPGAWGSFELELERNELRLDAGAVDVHVASLGVDLAFTPDLSWSTDLQWDDVSEELLLNSRVHSILGPGRELFLVLDQGWAVLDEGFGPTGTAATIKVGYTFRL